MKQYCLLFILSFSPLIASADRNGTYGENIKWTFVTDTHTLTISGTGEMKDNHYTNYPWYAVSTNVQSLIIEDGVTSIGNYAFYLYENLSSVTIGKSMTTIGNDAFWGCDNLHSLHIFDLASWCEIDFGSLESNPSHKGCRFYLNDTEIHNLEIPSGVTSIGDYSFMGCNLISVIIPNTVISIGRMAFTHCGLISVIIGTGVTSIGNDAFYDSNLKKVIWLPNTPPTGYRHVYSQVNYVSNKYEFFYDNQRIYPFLSSMFIVDGIKYVPTSPSERTCDVIDCSYNEKVSNINIHSTVIYNGIEMNVKDILPYAFYNNDNIESIFFNNVGIIDNYSFCECSNMKSITIGKNATSIGKGVFQDCITLQSVDIPDEINSLGESAFSGCFSLSTINIGKGIGEIRRHSFKDCKVLRAINIPHSVKVIDNYAFEGCIGLKNLIIDNRDEELSLGSNSSLPLFADCPLDSVYIGGNVTYDTSSGSGYSPFYRNTSLRTVVITDKETEISPYEFYGCTNLKNFSIGDGVTSFGDWSFSGCSSLKYFAFGSQVATIGKEVFSDCTAIIKIFSKALTAPACGSQALDDINKWECKLYVPKGCMSVYKAADQWKEFFFMEEGADTMEPDYIVGDVNGDGLVTETDVMHIIDKVLGNEPKNFNKEAADVNKDGKINVTDAVMTIEICNRGK